MRVELNAEIIERFVKARQALHLTQMELHLKSNVGLRTIKDIESGRRTSFNESTLICLCRALDLDCQEIIEELNGERSNSKRKITIPAVLVSLLSILLIISGYFGYISYNGKWERTDWINKEVRLKAILFNPHWDDTENRINVNYYHLDQVVATGDTVPVELKWSYHQAEGSYPVYYINAFTEWEPDKAIDLFEGILEGENSDTLYFEFVSPVKPGLCNVRVFFASAYAPMSSYYGHPPENQPSQPSSVPYLEIQIEVIEE